MTYRFHRPWRGLVEVDAASCQFTATHVVFRDLEGLVVLAEHHDQVHHLRDDEAVGSVVEPARTVRPEG